jgi:hypothetical protein
MSSKQDLFWAKYRHRQFLKASINAGPRIGVMMWFCGSCRHYSDGIPYGHCGIKNNRYIQRNFGYMIEEVFPDPPKCHEWDGCAHWQTARTESPSEETSR